MNTEEKSDTLVERTRELLRTRPVTKTYQVIVKDTGLSLGWLQKFAGDTERDPSSDRTQKLYEYLTEAPLFPTSQD